MRYVGLMYITHLVHALVLGATLAYPYLDHVVLFLVHAATRDHHAGYAALQQELQVGVVRLYGGFTVLSSGIPYMDVSIRATVHQVVIG